MFVRAVFNLGPDELAGTPGLAAKVKEAGVNTLTTGFFPNPADNGQKTYAQWLHDFSNAWERKLRITRSADMSLLLTGDDIARTAEELHATTSIPWIERAVTTAFTAARDSHRVVCIEMIDEASALWGDTPHPHDGRWLERKPPIPDDAFVKLMDEINAVPDRPPITWPVVGWASTTTARNWMGDPAFSDYATHYWDAGPGATPLEKAHALLHAVKFRQQAMPPGRPFLVLTGMTGPWYVKKGPGDRYTGRQDELIDAGATAASVANQIMLAAACGAAGVRVYGFDGLWASQRHHAKIGEKLQTGADPISGVGLERWDAMAAAFHLIGKIEPMLLGRMIGAPFWGPEFVTAAREGPEGRILMAISLADETLTPPVDLTPYLYPGGTIRQYTLQGSHLHEQTIAAPSTSVRLLPCQTVVWVMRPKP